VPQVSYTVILTRGRERAEVALRSIARQGPDAEVLLVLNDADEPMRALARDWEDRGARVLHDGDDLGVMLAYNLALRAAAAPLFCTVHEDSELDDGCLERLAATLREHPEAGAVCPRVDTPWVDDAGANVVWDDGAASQVRAPVDDAVLAIDYGGSSCLLARRHALAALGGFDVDFFPAVYGDADVGVRLWQAGWAVLCDRRAHSVHRTGAMVDEARGPRHGPRHRRFLVDRNRVRFAAKHATWLAGQATRSNPQDARRPSEAEVREALARAASRWRALSGPPAVGAPTLAPPDRLDAFVADRRRELADEFLAELLEENAALSAENERLHRAYADLHARHVALHEEAGHARRACAELQAELEATRLTGPA
jgi:GT2 family glycosyltransferase